MTTTSIRNVRLLLSIIAVLIFIPCKVIAAENTEPGFTNGIVDAISAGKLDLNMRLRFENVDDDAVVADANALTLRTALGYTTGKYNDFLARVLIQDVREVGINDYNDGTGRSASRARYAVVVDPEEIDFLEAYLAYSGIDKSTIKLGRQIITYRPGPLHRFIGTVGWRQNWQNFDAVSFVNKSIKDVTFSYAYVWNVNRIFTDEAVISSRANFHSNSHFINFQYTGFSWGKLEAYGYLLDFDNAAASSTATYGVRLSGEHSLSEKTKLIFAGEYARQDDYANNPAIYDEDYFEGEIGINIKVGNGIESVTLKFDYEVLGGNGVKSFITPLATAHAYQGWDDRFLATPADGIEDMYFTGNIVVHGFNLSAIYHDLSADNGGYDYGSEIDLQATKALNKHFTAGLKYADYNADTNVTNVLRNGAIALDVAKFWAWLQFTY